MFWLLYLLAKPQQKEYWISFPAFIPIIYAIIKENANSISDLRKVEKKYNLPSSWDEDGISSMDDLLEFNKGKFSIDEEIKESLQSWIRINESTIKQIVDSFKVVSDEEDGSETEQARLHSQRLII